VREETVAPHWYGTALEAQRSAAVISAMLGHRLRAWIPQHSLLTARAVTRCAACARPLEVHPYWVDRRFIGFVLTGAALDGACTGAAERTEGGAAE
jgi:hypothetical protein